MHQALRVYRQAIAIRNFGNLLGELIQVWIAGQGQGDILDHGKGFKQREMLEHHANAEAAGMRGILYLNHLAFPFHFTGIRFGDAVDHFHQG